MKDRYRVKGKPALFNAGVTSPTTRTLQYRTRRMKRVACMVDIQDDKGGEQRFNARGNSEGQGTARMKKEARPPG